MIHIFTAATGIYCKYLGYMAKTIGNLFPSDEKTINILSDKCHKCLFTGIDNCTPITHHMCNLPYPLITMLKFTYINDIITQHPETYRENDMIIFVDADTIFLNKPIDFWPKLSNEWKTHDIIYANHPLCIATPENAKKHYSPENAWVIPYNYYASTFSNDIHSASDHSMYDKIQKNNIYSCASFLITKPSILRRLNEDMMNILAIDLSNKHIPKMADMSILNKILFDVQLNDNTHYKYSTKHSFYVLLYNNKINLDVSNISCDLSSYTTTMMDIPYPETNDIFCVQKFNKNIKASKRNSDKYKENV